MGTIGGSFYYYIVGLRNGVPGRRVTSAIQEVKLHAPRQGSMFASWTAVFCSYDCTFFFIFFFFFFFLRIVVVLIEKIYKP